MQSAPSAIIAVVDDDPSVLESLDNLLQSVGYEVRCFSSGPALLDSGRLPQLHCLITDVEMPGMNGFELQDIAAAARPDLPVILITARYEPDNPSIARLNNKGFFKKPFDVDALLRAIAAALTQTG